jgi:hypothetical protein
MALPLPLLAALPLLLPVRVLPVVGTEAALHDPPVVWLMTDWADSSGASHVEVSTQSLMSCKV